jgi:hypothetical protein
MSEASELEEIRERERLKALTIFKAFRRGEVSVFDTLHEEFMWCNYELKEPNTTIVRDPSGTRWVKYIYSQINLVSEADPTDTDFDFDEQEVWEQIAEKFEKFNCFLIVDTYYVNNQVFKKY